MHYACLVSLKKPNQICGQTLVDWYPSSDANLEIARNLYGLYRWL